ncbi:MAG: sulfotransferase family protein [Acidobacteria bacterium]|nr:MAG: sulfotransferase family protein [Acidobacteriota bacterium]
MSSAAQKWWRRIRFGEPIVVVSGLPRSGTSMAMRMLEAGGMPLVVDGIRTADEDNPKGYFELERVKELDKGGDTSWLRQARGKAVKIISQLLLHLPGTNNYKVVFMQRDLTEVLASQRKMLLRRGEPAEGDDAQMRRLYEEHLDKVRFILRRRPWFETIYVQHREVLRDPLGQAKRIAAFVGRPLDVERMAGAVDPSLHRNRAEELSG